MERRPRSPARLLRDPRFAALAAASILARLPIGMGAVALVIFIHSCTGSFGIAGAGAGAFTLGFGLAGPFLGRLVDRRGTRAVLFPTTVLSAASLVTVVLLGDAGAGAGPLIAAAALTGATAPPVSGILRRAWPALVGPREITAAYLLDAILVEVVFIVGPLLTGLLAATVGPSAPPLLAAVLGLLGALWFQAVPEIAGLAPEPRHEHEPTGALASPTIRLLAFGGVAVGAGFGALDVALPAFGVAHGSAGLGGVFIAALGAGSILGALLYGRAPDRLGDLRRSTLSLAAIQPLVGAPLLFSPSVWLSVPLAMLAGSYAAPTFTVRNRVATLTLIAGTGTETFTLLLMSVMVGQSGGSALAGPLVAGGGWRLGASLAVAVPLACLPVMVAKRALIPRG
ncbi:MAG: MFS transporter [Actinobacteria bacterium]|nr:MFS transporter [Actinomycetota bacterium]